MNWSRTNPICDELRPDSDAYRVVRQLAGSVGHRRNVIIDITSQVSDQVRLSGIREGYVLVFAIHISASVFVNHHESGLWHDILAWYEGTVADTAAQKTES